MIVRGKRLKHLVYFLIAKLAMRFILFLPRRLAIALGVLFGDVAFILAKRERTRGLHNLSLAFGSERSVLEIKGILHECFRNIGKGLMEFIQLPKLNPSNIGKLVKFEGKQNLDEALGKGRGVIIITAHFGNWELLGASFSILGYPSNTIVRPAKMKRIDELVNNYRERTGLKCIRRDMSIKRAVRCLRRNELLGILADVDTKVDGVFVDFLGQPSYTPKGPVILSMKTGAVMLPAFIIRQKDNTHRLVIEKALDLNFTGNIEHDMIANIQAYTRVIESYIRKYPEQWIWFHDRWRTKDKKVDRIAKDSPTNIIERVQTVKACEIA